VVLVVLEFEDRAPVMLKNFSTADSRQSEPYGTSRKGQLSETEADSLFSEPKCPARQAKQI